MLLSRALFAEERQVLGLAGNALRSVPSPLEVGSHHVRELDTKYWPDTSGERNPELDQLHGEVELQ